MNDKSDLLRQLRIERAPVRSPGRSASPRRGRRWLAALIAVVLALGTAAAYLIAARPDALAVQVATAAPAPMNGAARSSSILDASGYVVARRQATVASKVTGKVQQILIEEGQVVRAGDVLARIDSSNAQADLALAQAQLSASRAAQNEREVLLAEAQRQLGRNRELASRKLVSESTLDAAQAQADQYAAQLAATRENIKVAERTLAVRQQLLDDTVVRAPFDGVVTAKNAQPGEIISPLSAGGGFTRTGIGTLVDMDSLEIEVDVNENFINRVKSGQPVTAKLNAYPDWEIPAEVIAVIPTADRSKATVRVRIGFKLQDPRILPEMGVRVAFLDAAPAASPPGQPAAVIVPAEAVSDGVVYVLQDEHVERRAVTVVGSGSAGTRIGAGLRAGERVAIGDRTLLRDGVRVRVEP
jgi:RND family efflux transporter MFP subunit